MAQKQVGELEVKTIPNMKTGQLKKIKIKSWLFEKIKKLLILEQEWSRKLKDNTKYQCQKWTAITSCPTNIMF